MLNWKRQDSRYLHARQWILVAGVVKLAARSRGTSDFHGTVPKVVSQVDQNTKISRLSNVFNDSYAYCVSFKTRLESRLMVIV
jgi:hypothetical protein